jgi:hypothetical protein
MKNSIKVFIWIGMLLFGFLIFPIIIGIKAYRILDKPNVSSREVSDMALLTLLFVQPIAGILMFALKDSDFKDVDIRQPSQEINQLNIKGTTMDIFDSIKLAHNLYKQEFISKDNFIKKKKEVLSKLNNFKSSKSTKNVSFILRLFHLIISFFWFGLLLLTVFGDYYYGTGDLILLFYIILTSIFTYSAINTLVLALAIKFISYLNFFLMIFFFLVIAPYYSFSGLVPIMAIFAGLQFFLSLSTIITLNKKERKSYKLINPEEITQKAKFFFDEGILSREELQIIINMFL